MFIILVVLTVLSVIVRFLTEKPFKKLIVLPLTFFIFGSLSVTSGLTIAYDNTSFYVMTLIGIIYYSYLANDMEELLYKLYTHIKLVVAVVVVIAGVIFFSTNSWPNYDRYHNLIGEVEVVEFSSDEILPIQDKELEEVIEVKTAIKLASNGLEQIESGGSKFSIVSANKIIFSGTIKGLNAEGKLVTRKFDKEQIWVSPLEHSGWTRQLSNEYTDGYRIVSSTNKAESYLVTEVNGKALKMKYLKHSSFFSNAIRHIWLNGYMTSYVTDYSFELDDEGMPFIVASKYEKTIGLSGDDVVSVIVLDVQSGDIVEYDLDKVPAWVDRVHPIKFIHDQLTDYGAYAVGYWNFAKDQFMKPTYGMSTLIAADGSLSFYTGMQSKGSDTSSNAFVLVDSRTKKVKLFKRTGITEDAAVNSIKGEQIISSGNYTISQPKFYNVSGNLAFFMTANDSQSLPSKYAFVSQLNQSVKGIGSTKAEALANFKKSLRSINTDSMFSSDFEITELDVVVNDFYLSPTGGMYFTIEGQEEVQFFVPQDLMIEAGYTKPNDNAKIKYVEEAGVKTYTVEKFDLLRKSLIK